MFQMKLSGALFVALAALLGVAEPALAKDAPRVLVFSHSTGYRHDSIEAAVVAVKALGAKAGYTMEESADPEIFTAEKLAPFRAIVLVSNSTNPKDPNSEWFQGSKRDALQGFLKAGKGVVALHAAADSHYHWGWYGQMVGGYFERHPKGTPTGTIKVVDAKHPATAKLPKTITRNDEWYYYKDFNPEVRVLLTIDPATIGPTGEADANPNPLAWSHEFGGGRVFYTGLGHTKESYSEPYIVDHIAGGLAWALGKKK
jgi:type 1 glutamine amidotransferase